MFTIYSPHWYFHYVYDLYIPKRHFSKSIIWMLKTQKNNGSYNTDSQKIENDIM